MAIHYTSFVMPRAVMGLEYDSPFLVFGADTADEVRTIPAVTSLHRIGNVVLPYSHASMVMGEVPVTDLWGKVAAEQYDQRAKVVVVRDPVPADISTEYAELTKGVLGPDLPPWLGLMLAQELRCYARDVPVSVGTGPEDVMSILIDPTAPTTFPAWAQTVIPPGS